ncbi:MAG TPA: hypothetical protein DE312_05730 [Gallionella sp.]|nr:MAG: hypothetical protein A2Z87_07120 [Gallionellales bacterium GWA2_54_124]OGT20868.1 MAG: hypothetical protein A2522_01770 [Gallionellales bacterium RIFOXYD12_FULL_53_10]OGT24244.1 MAG: hypothetical protein A3K00_05950 [Gallionellales bacterium RIFOXYD2_FULL_52_7]HCI52805.1 hypothetical protein [Gallionella sp.]
MSLSQIKPIIWRSPKGEVIACVEKNKVMSENLEEIRQICQDALDDAVLMGVDSKQVRQALAGLIAELVDSYSPQD